MRDYIDNGITYRIDDMDPIQAFHVMRKLAPLLNGLSGLAHIKDRVITILDTLGATESDDKEGRQVVLFQNLEILLSALSPLTLALSTMPDADCEFVIRTCLAHVHKVEGNTSMPVWNVKAKRFQYTLKLPAILTLTSISIVENLGDFFTAKA